MFKCDVCKQDTKPGESMQHLVAAVRRKTYPYRPNAHRYKRFDGHKHHKLVRDDPGGTGTEIVRELRVCDDCKLTATLEAIYGQSI